MVNGKRLELSKDDGEEHQNGQKVYTRNLNHLDRIFVGVNTLFLFKYPLQKQKARQVMEDKNLSSLTEAYKSLEESEDLIAGEDPINPICVNYTSSEIDEDNKNIMSYEQAYAEAHQCEELEKE